MMPLQIEFALPPRLNTLMLQWVKEGHAAAQEGRAVKQELLFFNISPLPRFTGTPISAAQLSGWWQQLLATHGKQQQQGPLGSVA